MDVYSLFLIDESSDGNRKSRLSKKDSIEKVLNFHQEIVENRSTLDSSNNRFLTAIFSYKTNEGKEIERQYDLPYAFIKTSPAYSDLFTCSEVQRPLELTKSTQDELLSATVTSKITNEPLNIPVEKLPELITCLNKDFMEETLNDAIALELPYSTIDIRSYDKKSYEKAAISGKKPKKADFYRYNTFAVKSYYTHTLSWLKQYLSLIHI